jgi:hypothetical protein
LTYNKTPRKIMGSDSIFIIPFPCKLFLSSVMFTKRKRAQGPLKRMAQGPQKNGARATKKKGGQKEPLGFLNLIFVYTPLRHAS